VCVLSLVLTPFLVIPNRLHWCDQSGRQVYSQDTQRLCGGWQRHLHWQLLHWCAASLIHSFPCVYDLASSNAVMAAIAAARARRDFTAATLPIIIANAGGGKGLCADADLEATDEDPALASVDEEEHSRDCTMAIPSAEQGGSQAVVAAPGSGSTDAEDVASLPGDEDLERNDQSSTGAQYVGLSVSLVVLAPSCHPPTGFMGVYNNINGKFQARTPEGFVEAGEVTSIGSFSTGALPP
jgi:hypothetical protein